MGSENRLDIHIEIKNDSKFKKSLAFFPEACPILIGRKPDLNRYQANSVIDLPEELGCTSDFIQEVSSNHLTIEYQNGEFYFRDHSTNGTYTSIEQLTAKEQQFQAGQRHPIRTGMRLRLKNGKHDIFIRIGKGSSSTVAHTEEIEDVYLETALTYLLENKHLAIIGLPGFGKEQLVNQIQRGRTDLQINALGNALFIPIEGDVLLRADAEFTKRFLLLLLDKVEQEYSLWEGGDLQPDFFAAFKSERDRISRVSVESEFHVHLIAPVLAMLYEISRLHACSLYLIFLNFHALASKMPKALIDSLIDLKLRYPHNFGYILTSEIAFVNLRSSTHRVTSLPRFLQNFSGSEILLQPRHQEAFAGLVASELKGELNDFEKIELIFKLSGGVPGYIAEFWDEIKRLGWEANPSKWESHLTSKSYASKIENTSGRIWQALPYHLQSNLKQYLKSQEISQQSKKELIEIGLWAEGGLKLPVFEAGLSDFEPLKATAQMAQTGVRGKTGLRLENGRFTINQADLTRYISGKKEEAVLLYLYERRNEICEISEIFEACWQQSFVELAENNREAVQQTVHRLRSSIKKIPEASGLELISTYKGKGYQLNV